MLVDLDILHLFEGKISKEHNLYFFGETENSWCIIYPDLTSFETEDFFKVINPYKDVLIHHLHFFRNIREAMLFFRFKRAYYFKNSLLVVCGMKSNSVVKRHLDQYSTSKNAIVPKLHFYHSPRYFDMVGLYLEILDKGIRYRTVEINGSRYLKIRYQSANIQLGFGQISKSRICFLLGINDRKFKIRNHFLSDEIINQNLMW